MAVMGKNADYLERVNPKESYEHQEYPKALYPPKVSITSADHELEMRAQWGTPLPYGGDAAAFRHQESYFTRQTYPKLMQPPHIEVNSPEEERRVLASWKMSGADPVEKAQWPKWRFHATEDAKLVQSEDEASKLGPGWYATIREALAEERDKQAIRAQANSPEVQATEEEERATLYKVAAENFIKVDKRWATDKLRKAVYGEDHPSVLARSAEELQSLGE